jgi:natural product biosynthesis luciferase-like monooxygenase protein
VSVPYFVSPGLSMPFLDPGHSFEESQTLYQPPTLVSLLRQRAEAQPGRLAYTFLADGEGGESRLTYGELDRRARSVAAQLQSLGAAGERVLLLYPPGLDYIAAFFGCLYAGAVAVPVYPPRQNKTLARIAAIVGDARPSVALTTAQILSRMTPLLAASGDLSSMRWVSFEGEADGAEGEWRESVISGDTLAFLQYTSGSTGNPKGVMLSHGNLLHNSAMLRRFFEYTPESYCVSWLPVYHDMGLIGGVLQPLYGGFPCTLISPISFLQRPVRWLEAISRYRATISGGPNFAYELCVRKIGPEQVSSLDLNSWSTAFNGAEPIRAETMDRFAEAFAPCGFRRQSFFACYGLAEAALIVSGGKKADPPVIKHFQLCGLESNSAVESAPGAKDARPLVGCGRNLLDTRVIIVSPETLTKCPQEEIGEVWVAGGSVAQGYWDRPAETAGAFNAFTADTAEGPFLRTGDLGLLQDGELFITGRLKDLIIIRGLNHYPQDIELTVERSHPSLRPGCGAAFSIQVDGHLDGAERLVVVQEIDRHQSDFDAIIDRIRRNVAEEHELQVCAAVLIKPGSLPKTSSGKIQRHACRAAFLKGTLEFLAEWRESSVYAGDPGAISKAPPETGDGLEAWLVSQIAVRAGVEPSEIDIHRPIDHYGMDSLMAIELAHNIESNLGMALPMAGFLGGVSISQLVSRALAALEKMNGAPRAREIAGPQARQNGAIHPLSHGQRALWFLQRLAPESASYNIVGAATIRADLDLAALRRSFQTILDRHACLRTTFTTRDGRPFQQAQDRMESEFHQEDASTWSDSLLVERLTELAHRPFDLENGPLLRVAVFIRSAQEHVILLATHHIISDFWSLAVLLDELRVLYPAERLGTRPELAPLKLNYTDFVRRQSEMLASQEGERLWSYWKNHLAGAPALDLPTDRPRPPVQTYSGASNLFKLDARLTQELKQLGRSQGATLFMTLLAGFQALLHRYTGQEDLLTGSLAAGRDSAELAGLVGYFVNPLVLRADLSGLPTYAALLSRTCRTALAAFDHQQYPFPLLVERLQPERDAARSPIFQVMFILQKAYLLEADGLASLAVGESGAQVSLGELHLESVRINRQAAQFDLTLVMAEVDGCLSASLQYNTDLFDAATMVRLAGHLQTLFKSIVEAPDRPVSTLTMLTHAEQYSLLVARNSTRADYLAGLCIHHLIENRARASADRIAAVYENEQLSFQELNRRADRLAGYLQGLGVGPQVLVGVCVERSLDLLVGMLGILKAGGAYVPLDPAYPRERLEFMIEDAMTPVIVTERRLVRSLAPTTARLVCLDSEGCLSEQVELEDPPKSGVVSDNAAYVIYTSGSTGKPKGVMVSHRNVVNFFQGMDNEIGCQESDTMLALTSISFDISALELLWTMARGAKVVLLAEQALMPASRTASRARIEKKIDFSLFYFASNGSQSKEERYRLLFEGAKFADARGFEAVWTPERHFHAFGGLFPNPSVLSAALAAVTERVQIRAGSVVLPLHHPIRIAEEWSLVDNISHGRVGIAFASGWHADDFVFSPESYVDRKEITFKGVETVRGLWRGEPAKAVGGAGNEIEVKIYPTPVQAELPVWITAAGTPETFIKAGEMGANVLTHLLGQTIEEVAERVGLYRRALAERGRDPRSGRVTLMLHTYIDQGLDLVREKVRVPFTNYLRSSIGLISNLIKSLNLPLDLKSMSEKDLDDLLGFAFARYFETSALFGTPETCAGMIERLKEIGVDEVACLIDFGVEVDSAISGLRRLDQLKELSNSHSGGPGGPVEVDYSLPAQAARHRPTLMQCTPSMMRMLMADAHILDTLGSLRVLMLGGEALPHSLVSEAQERLPAAVVNMYGPTETTIWSSTHRIERTDRAISIGHPIANTQLYILDRRLQPLPAGLTGELHIAGTSLALGYLNHPDLTAQRFIPNQFGAKPGERMYKTGDLTRYLEDGSLAFLGRIDQQVKLRGFRIELEEIEAALNEHEDVREAVVTLREDSPGDKRLVAYLVPAPGGRQSDDRLEAFLRQKLPDYMIPSNFVILDRLPQTSNGKVDRKRLPAVEGLRKQSKSEYIQPKGELEGLIAGIWQEALKVDRVGREDNFFDLGGHSLLLAQVHGQLCKALDKKLPLIKMLEHPTVSSLARFLNHEGVDSLSIEQNQDRAGKLREGIGRQRRSTVKARYSS